AKFRDSSLEFKNFQVGAKVDSALPAEDLIARVTKAVAGMDGPAGRDLLDKLTDDAPASLAVLRQRAKKLEQEAAQLRQLAEQVHQERVLAELAKLLQTPDDQIDLLHAGLLIARLDNEELDVRSYCRQVERMGHELLAKLPKEASDREKLA